MNKLDFINVGFGNYVNINKVVAICNATSSPIKRMADEARDVGRLVDLTFGRKTLSAIITGDGYVVLSAVQRETLSRRFNFLIGKEEIK